VKSKLESSLTDTLKNSQLSSVISDAGELSLDSILKDGLLKDIPVISSMLNLFKLGVSLQNYFLLSKLLSFLKSLDNVNIESRKQAIKKLEADTEYSQNVGEHLILLLDRMDDLNKPKMIARAFTAYCKKEINSVQLQRLYYAIDRILLCDNSHIKTFLNNRGKEELPVDIEQNFVNSGLGYVKSGYGVGGVYPTELCGLFYKYALQKE
jgi:hypothetical protein